MGSTFSSNDERDGRQRRFGCFGVSMMAHVGLLALLALAPQANEPFGQVDGNGVAGIDMNPDAATVADPAAAPAGDSQAQYTEVLLADASDTTAVAVPEEALATSSEALEEQKLPEMKLAKAEIPMPAKALPKAVPAKALPKAAKASAPAATSETITSDESDTQIQSALQAARMTQPEEELPPASADLSADEAAATETQDVALNDSPAEKTPEKTEEEKLAEFTPPPPVQEEVQLEEKPEPQPPVAVIPQQPAPQPVAQQPAQPTTQLPARVMAQPMAIASNSRVAGLNGGTGAPTQGLVANGATGTGQTGRSMGGTQMGVPLGVQIRDASDLVARPGNRPPPYPQQDRLLGRQGTTVVIGKVNSQGSVDEVMLERSSGSRLMDQEAMRAFKQWKYMPGQQGFVRQPFKFALTGEAQELPARLRR